MDLIIVESPTKARTLSRFLGKNYIVDSTMGHIRDLPKSKLGIDVENDFDPDYVQDVKKKEIISNLRKGSLQSDKVFLATDPDREGEAISWHTKEVLELTKARVSRIVFHEITKQAVEEAIKHPREINLDLVDAQQARRVLDRLVGYKLSPLLWKKVRRGLSAGRVQSVAVRLIVEREREIDAFESQEYWEISSKLNADKLKLEGRKTDFEVKLVRIGDKSAKINNKVEADKVVSDLEKSAYSVISVQKREVVRHPWAPFTTSTMTQSSSREFYWSAKKTMSVAQKLYEEGLITYHRTDSTSLSAQALVAAREFLKEKLPEYLPPQARTYKTSSKLAQEAHEAVRPTNVNILSDSKQVEVHGLDSKKLYDLIWRRFVASQMKDAIFDETKIKVKAEYNSNVYTMRASGQIMKCEGWRKLFKSKGIDEVIQLPEVEENETLYLIKVVSSQKFTEPPPRFTEATLIKTLEKLGIGRPSTYAPTISTILTRQYVEKKEGKFIPTSVGTAVNDFLVDNFTDVFEYSFTAGLEEELDSIAQGKRKWIPVVKKFWEPFNKKLESVEKNSERVKIKVELTGIKCPICGGGDEIVRLGKFGKFLSCSLFPECKYTAPFFEKANMKCPNCNTGEVIIKKTRRGKSFFGCNNYPNCKWASWKKPDNLANKEDKVILNMNNTQNLEA